MEYMHATLLLHETGREINETNLRAVLEAAGAPVVESRVKAIVAALEGVDIDRIDPEPDPTLLVSETAAGDGAEPTAALETEGGPTEGGEEGTAGPEAEYAPGVDEEVTGEEARSESDHEGGESGDSNTAEDEGGDEAAVEEPPDEEVSDDGSGREEEEEEEGFAFEASGEADSGEDEAGAR